MNPRLTHGCVRAASNYNTSAFSHKHILSTQFRGNSVILRSYAVKKSSITSTSSEPTPPEKTALVAVEHGRPSDSINPPRSTLPAPLDLPRRQDETNVLMYYYRLGRSYGKFYWIGIKAVWFNYKAAQTIKERIQKETGKKLDSDAILSHLSRSEYQILQRNNHDIGKLPFFSLLVAIVGEWLPLFVAFMPGVVPGTCRIPKQLAQMRVKSEERRRSSFRRGVSAPVEEGAQDQNKSADTAANSTYWTATKRDKAAELFWNLRDDQLHHLSCVLNLHSRLWDRIQLAPPSFLLRRALAKRLVYLTIDDKLLGEQGGADKLNEAELEVACEERGLDVSGIRHDTLRSHLAWWLARQREDRGAGRAVLTMLFRRPNVWKDIQQPKR